MKNKQDTLDYLNQVHDAAQWIGRRLLKLRVPVRDMKEKWGEVRVYCSFGYWSFHDLVYPGYAFNQFPRWLQSLDYHLLGPLLQHLYWVTEPVHKWWYKRTYKKALEKFPHLRDAILNGADWPELL